jgi:hypothetical protein
MNSQPDANETPCDAASPMQPDIDFNSTHHLITAFMTALQSCFIKETGYAHTLVNPQGNVFFVPDEDFAKRMTDYVSNTLTRVGGFAAHEFNFRQRSGAGDGTNQHRLRLDFTHGITLSMLRKIANTTQTLEKQ